MKELQRVLVVDDDQDIRELAEFSLGEFGGLEVRLAATSEEALTLLAEFQPDLVLCDVMMPGVSGPQLLERIRTTSTVPLIFLTARTAGSEAYPGAAAVMAKPFDPLTLADQVRAIWGATGGPGHTAAG